MPFIQTEWDGKLITISNPEKLLWEDPPIRKMDYIHHLVQLAPYILPYTRDRLLTTIRYPEGIDGKSFYQKNKPVYAPEWIKTALWENTNYIVLNDPETLVWLGNQACLELHTSFHRLEDELPTEMVIDLDPMGSDFGLVAEVALLLNEVLVGMGLACYPKTSGATGLQLYIPIQRRYTFQQTRSFNEFLAKYFTAKYPQKVTIERMVKERGTKLYFDYLQHWRGKTLAAPYTTRARPGAPVSTPVLWKELEKGIHPTDFNLTNILSRLQKMGDIFSPLVSENHFQSLDSVLQFIEQKKVVH